MENKSFTQVGTSLTNSFSQEDNNIVQQLLQHDETKLTTASYSLPQPKQPSLPRGIPTPPASSQKRKAKNAKNRDATQSMSPQQMDMSQQQQQQNLLLHGHIHQTNTPQYPSFSYTQFVAEFLHHQWQIPKENNIYFWRKYVYEYYDPYCRERSCLSTCKDPENCAPYTAWQCCLCASAPAKGYQLIFKDLPEAYAFKFDNNVAGERFSLLWSYEYKPAPGVTVLVCPKATQRTIIGRFGKVSVVREGVLQVGITEKFKILFWDFCIGREEEYISVPSSWHGHKFMFSQNIQPQSGTNVDNGNNLDAASLSHFQNFVQPVNPCNNVSSQDYSNNMAFGHAPGGMNSTHTAVSSPDVFAKFAAMDQVAATSQTQEMNNNPLVMHSAGTEIIHDSAGCSNIVFDAQEANGLTVGQCVQQHPI